MTGLCRRTLLKDALLRTAQAADIAGIRCLAVHAKDDDARQWYEAWDFEASPTDPYHLFLMLKDLKLAMEAAQHAGAYTPLGAQAEELYQRFVNLGGGSKDFSGIIKMLDDSWKASTQE